MPVGHRPFVASVCLAAVLTLVVSACSEAEPPADTEGAAETQPLTVMIAEAQAFRLPVRVAAENGMFADRGIDITIVPQPANLQAFQGLEAAGAQIGQITLATLGQAVQAGQSGALFCGTLPVIQTSLMAPTDSDLPSVEEGASWQEVLQSLDGKIIGIQTPLGSALQLIFASALEEVGVSNVTFVNLGPASTAAQAALANGSVDVAQANPTGTQFMITEGAAKELVYLPSGPEAYRNAYGSGWVATTDWLEEEPDLAAAFCEAFEEALDFIQDPANTEESSTLLQEETGVAPDVADLVMESVFDDYSAELDEETIQDTLDTYVALGILEGEPHPDAEQLIATP